MYQFILQMKYYSYCLIHELDLITFKFRLPLFGILSFIFFSLENLTFARVKLTYLENDVKQKNNASVYRCNQNPRKKQDLFLTDGKSDQICMKGRDIERENEKKIWAQMYLH